MAGERMPSKRRRRKPKLAPRFHAPPAVADPRSAEMTRANGDLAHELLATATSRCFIVKSFSDANLHKSLKFGVWSSTYAHNAALDQAFTSELASARPVLLFFRCDAAEFCLSD